MAILVGEVAVEGYPEPVLVVFDWRERLSELIIVATLCLGLLPFTEI